MLSRQLLKGDEGFIDDRASNGAFRQIIENWRATVAALCQPKDCGSKSNQAATRIGVGMIWRQRQHLSQDTSAAAARATPRSVRKKTTEVQSTRAVPTRPRYCQDRARAHLQNSCALVPYFGGAATENPLRWTRSAIPTTACGKLIISCSCILPAVHRNVLNAVLSRLARRLNPRPTGRPCHTAHCESAW